MLAVHMSEQLAKHDRAADHERPSKLPDAARAQR